MGGLLQSIWRVRQFVNSRLSMNGLAGIENCLSTTYSALNAHYSIRRLSVSIPLMKKPEYPPLEEKELEEDFVLGSGPGGQSVNRTMNCVVLKHITTGITVKCHESRSLPTNRKRARERLQEKLDIYYHGENSTYMVQKREEMLKYREKKRQSKARLEKKKAFKEREGLDI